MSDLGSSLEDLLPDSESSQKDSSAQSKLKQKMQEINLLEKEQEIETQAQVAGLPYINLVGFPISPDAFVLIKQEISKKLGIICFLNTGKDIRLGTTSYTDEIKKLEKEMAEKYFAEVSTYLISQNSFEQSYKLYDTLPKARKFRGGVDIKEEDLNRLENEIKNFHQLDEIIKKVTITEMVTLIIAAAIKSRASDIHIEGEENAIKVRYRIDGVLNDVASIDKANWPRVISRIKQLSKLKININDRPQDGRFSIHLKDDRIDVRVSCLPTAFGESVVMRLLRASFDGLSFEELGLRGQAMEILAKEITRPNGMIVTTGPTGSGKTTSLYAILRRLNNPEIKIITIEDPIEYQLKGINQSQVSEQYTFSKGLRSIIRQDPDIVMVGEIRDLETAEIAIQAALTGHLVLSTIHTNDAFGAIPRFMSMGSKPFLLAPALNVSIGQRLVRKICESCKKEIQLETTEMEKVKKLLESLPPNCGYKTDMNNLKFYMGEGCQSCQNIGYLGRIGIFEIMPINDKMKQLMTTGNISEYDIKKLAFEDGIITMAQDGILKALDGLTSIKEIFRVAE